MKYIIGILIFMSLNVSIYAVDYYQITKLTNQAKKLPYLNHDEKDKSFKKIQNQVKKMSDKEKDIIKPQLEGIYAENKKIEQKLRMEQFKQIGKTTSNPVINEYKKVKKKRKKRY